MSDLNVEHSMHRFTVELPDDNRQVAVTLPIELPKASDAPAFLVPEARALVAGEQQRFGSLQTQAAGFLAIIGVVASIGIGFSAPYLSGHHFLGTVHAFGLAISIAECAVIVFGLLTVTALTMTAIQVFGALRRRPDPEATELAPIVRDQIPELVDEEPSQATKVLLQLAAAQFQRVQEANQGMEVVIRSIVQAMILTTFSGFLLAATLVFGTAADHRETFVIERGHKPLLTVHRDR